MIEFLLTEHLKHIHARNILDVGPGYGDFSRIAARLTGARHITYLDCNEAILQWQKAACEKAGITSEELAVNLDMDSLTDVKGRYDLILCQEVLEHLSNAEEVLSFLIKHLNKGGHAVITVPTKSSERWLKRINPAYMRDEPHGHVREFDESALRKLLSSAGLVPITFVPTQPHYFIGHTMLFLTRMKVEGSTGRVLTGGFRGFVLKFFSKGIKRFFMLTGPYWWGRVLSRNYFVVAQKP
jgi:SAM-dependent methyltransferase